jgi:hypothetical protein
MRNWGLRGADVRLALKAGITNVQGCEATLDEHAVRVNGELAERASFSSVLASRTQSDIDETGDRNKDKYIRPPTENALAKHDG